MEEQGPVGSDHDQVHPLSFEVIVADNGSNWFISGASDPSFDDDQLGQLKGVPGDSFEVVKLGKLYQ